MCIQLQYDHKHFWPELGVITPINPSLSRTNLDGLQIFFIHTRVNNKQEYQRSWITTLQKYKKIVPLSIEAILTVCLRVSWWWLYISQNIDIKASWKYLKFPLFCTPSYK